MAAPQTHAVMDLLLVGILALLAALGVFHKITLWEYLSVIFWGFLIDFDHLLSWSWVKDLPNRIFKRGGGAPKAGLKAFPSWLHLWPGFILVWLWGIVVVRFFEPTFRLWLPFVFWSIHVVIDYYQRSEGVAPHLHFFYPFNKKLYYREKGYPIKRPVEFILDSFILALVCLVLVGFIIAK